MLGPKTLNWIYDRSSHMAGLAINPVQVFWTGRALHCEFVRLETGFELPNSSITLPCYGLIRNRSGLDFMRWSDFDHRAQDMKES